MYRSGYRSVQGVKKFHETLAPRTYALCAHNHLFFLITARILSVTCRSFFSSSSLSLLLLLLLLLLPVASQLQLPSLYTSIVSKRKPLQHLASGTLLAHFCLCTLANCLQERDHIYQCSEQSGYSYIPAFQGFTHSRGQHTYTETKSHLAPDAICFLQACVHYTCDTECW